MGGIKSRKVFPEKISDKKRKTYLRMFRSAVGAAVVIIIVLIVLQLLGINVSSMLAGVGIASIVIGFALQDAMKDVFRGLEIVSDNYYDIGDVISYGSNVGQVLSINLRTTKIQDINTMNIVSIANRNIDKVEIVSEYIYLTVPLPYEIKPSAAKMLTDEIADKISDLPDVKTVTNQGINQIAESTLHFQLAITCDPMDKLSVNRAATRVIIETFSAHKLRLPYSHLDVHTKK